MSIVALFIMVKDQKQARYLPTGQWINKLWYIYAMSYYSSYSNNNTGETQVYFAKEKKPDQKSTYINFQLYAWKKAKLQKWKTDNGFQELGN